MNMKEQILKLDAAVPRYTSYPAAPSFQPGFPESACRGWLSAAGDGPLSLYVHIPFCSRLCYYCGCNTHIANDYGRVESYVDTLGREIGMVADFLKSRRVSHLHFGGGSPTLLRPPAFARLMNDIRGRFEMPPGAEIAVEADPRQMSEARIAAFAANGVTRISLGVQDFDEAILRRVNRPQTPSQSWEAARLCRAYGIHGINFDLMYGLPGQSVQSIARTIEIALTMKPDRVSFFGYAHVPWMKKHMDLMDDLPGPALRYDLYEAGSGLLKDAGYVPVGIDHFALPSDSMAIALRELTLRRNFQGYTTDTATTLIGFGASAIGRFAEGYSQNIADLRLYTQAVGERRLPVNKGFVIDPADRIHGEVIGALMCFMEADLDAARARYDMPRDYFAPYAARLEPLIAAGLVALENGVVRILHPHAARLAAHAFDRAASPGPPQKRHSQAV